ncbi:MAG: S1 family peptidase, partial [Brasilonema sp.]
GWIVHRQGNRAWIVTNKHVVAKGKNADEVDVELYYGDLPEDIFLKPRITARIIERTLTKNDADLALLEVQSPEFPKDIGHLSMFERASQQDKAISVVGNTDFKWINGTVVSTSTTTSTLIPRLEKGYSGSPVLNPQNQVVGLLYEIDPQGKPHSYAHPISLIAAKLQEWIGK